MPPAESPRKITDAEREFQAFRTLRIAHANQRHEGARKVRAAKVGFTFFMASVASTELLAERGRRGSKKEIVYPGLFVVSSYHLPVNIKFGVILVCRKLIRDYAIFTSST